MFYTIEQVKDFFKSGKILGAVAISALPKNKYYNLRNDVYELTKFCPDGVEFKNRVHCIMNDINEWPIKKKCECGCGQYVNNFKTRFLPSHGNKSDVVKAKKVAAYQRKYGVDNPSMADEIKYKKSQTCLENYGYTSHMSSPDYYKNVYTKIILDRHGVENNFQLSSSIKKIAEHRKNNPEFYKQISAEIGKTERMKFYDYFVNYMAEKYPNIQILFKKEEYNGMRLNGSKYLKYKFKCTTCGTEFDNIIPTDSQKLYCPKCVSNKAEKDLYDLIKSIGVENLQLRNKSIIWPYELDIVATDYNVAIEYDGLYWHNSSVVENNYHVMKTNKCLEKSVRLIHVFEDEFIFKRKIVRNNLKQIFSKHQVVKNFTDTTIKLIDKEVADNFLKKRLLKFKENSTICCGAFYKNRLVAVMTLNEISTANYELNNFAEIGSYFKFTNVDRVLFAFLKKQLSSGATIWLSLDRRWHNDFLALKLSFNFFENIEPDYYYTRNKYERFEKSCFDGMLNSGELEIPDREIDEIELMEYNGFDRIFDCGCAIYKYNVK